MQVQSTLDIQPFVIAKDILHRISCKFRQVKSIFFIYNAVGHPF